MSYTDDPENNAVDRVRLTVGDIDPCDELLSDEVYKFALTNNNDDEIKASIQILKHIVAMLANSMTEKTGEVFLKANERYKQYKELLDTLIKDPSTSFMRAGAGYTGGIYQSEIDANNNNSNTVKPPFKLGWSTNINRYSGGYYERY